MHQFPENWIFFFFHENYLFVWDIYWIPYAEICHHTYFNKTREADHSLKTCNSIYASIHNGYYMVS